MRLYLVAYQTHQAEFVGAAIVEAFDQHRARERAEAYGAMREPRTEGIVLGSLLSCSRRAYGNLISVVAEHVKTDGR
jgi:hypothetical protein